jgi:hypothetical protein
MPVEDGGGAFLEEGSTSGNVASEASEASGAGLAGLVLIDLNCAAGLTHERHLAKLL